VNNRVKKEVNKAIPTFNTPLILYIVCLLVRSKLPGVCRGCDPSILILITPYEDFSIRLNRVVDLSTIG
jgi:hypothetical protein